MTVKLTALSFLLLGIIFNSSVVFAYPCPPGGVVSAYEVCRCAGSQMYIYRVSCVGSGSGCDPLGGGYVYCTVNCAQINAASCSAGHAPTQDGSPSLADSLDGIGPSRSACINPDPFRRWLSGRLHRDLDHN